MDAWAVARDLLWKAATIGFWTLKRKHRDPQRPVSIHLLVQIRTSLKVSFAFPSICFEDRIEEHRCSYVKYSTGNRCNETKEIIIFHNNKLPSFEPNNECSLLLTIFPRSKIAFWGSCLTNVSKIDFPITRARRKGTELMNWMELSIGYTRRSGLV